MYFTDTHKLNKQAYNALKRIRNAKKSKDINIKDKISLISESTNQINKNKYNLVFMEFDEAKFEEKVKLDRNIYNKLFEKLDSESKTHVSKIISEMVGIVKDVYKFINIEPKILGYKNISSDDSKHELLTEASNIINNYFNREYYSLSTDEKRRKYKDSVLDLAYELVVQENIEMDEALKHSYKSIVIENLIRTINFPYIIKHKINEVFEDTMYNDFFDVDELSNLMEAFDLKVKQVSRIVSAIIE